MSQFAPISLFVFNRLIHTQATIESLKKNELAEQSELIIFSDGSRDDQTLIEVQAVRNYIQTVNGFKSVKIIERDVNWGLAENIIAGVTEVINQYGKVIVLEDDIVTSPAFLSFMNQALDIYENKNEVWHVSGWNYPIDSSELSDTFFIRVMDCWGWGTWANRWRYFEKDPQRLIDNWSTKQKMHFDLDGSGIFWKQVEDNANGKINTWAIFWYATIYEKGGLCLNPSKSYVENIGLDGSGVNCGNSQALEMNIPVLATNKQINFQNDLKESYTAREAIKSFYKKQKKPFLVRAVNALARLTIRKNVI